jgi:hypothetical protein
VVSIIWKSWPGVQNIHDSEALEQLADLGRAEEAEIQEWSGSRSELDAGRSRV